MRYYEHMFALAWHDDDDDVPDEQGALHHGRLLGHGHPPLPHLPQQAARTEVYFWKSLETIQ